MTNKLKVIKPFYVMDVDDELDLVNGLYVSVYNEEYNQIGDTNTGKATYSSTFSISPTVAKDLLEKGFLAEVKPVEPKSTEKINVFDKMDRLSAMYKQDLKDAVNDPFDLQKQTVLTNLLNLINYLKSLKH